MLIEFQNPWISMVIKDKNCLNHYRNDIKRKQVVHTNTSVNKINCAYVRLIYTYIFRVTSLEK